MIIPLFGFIHGIGFLIFMLVVMAFMKQCARLSVVGLRMLRDEFEDRQVSRLRQEFQRERAIEHLQKIRQSYERSGF